VQAAPDEEALEHGGREEGGNEGGHEREEVDEIHGG
jgi:hypothetical protein